MYRQLRITLIVVSLTVLSSCASSGSKYDAGYVDHRYVYADRHVGPKYFEHDKLHPPDDLLKPGDSLAIRLTAVFVCDFSEDTTLSDAFVTAFSATDSLDNDGVVPTPCVVEGSSQSKHRTRGEIAILADVFEQGGDRKVAFAKNSFELKDARVVYYDDDVRESGQYLSLANIPIYGPITYQGHPLFLRLYMLELDDDESQQMSAMLKKLADLGGKAYPPASPVLKTLSSIGGSLLSGEQDDLELRYTMTFDSPGGTAHEYLPLAIGTYIVAKSRNRSIDAPWNAAYDRTTGRLTQANTSLREVTYLVFKVTKNEAALEQDSAQLYSHFEQTKTAPTRDLAHIEEATDLLALQYAHATVLDAARSHVASLKKNAPNQISIVSRLQAITDVTNIICDAAVVTDDATGNSLSQDEIQYLLASLPEGCLTDPNHGLLSFWRGNCTATPGSMSADSSIDTLTPRTMHYQLT